MSERVIWGIAIFGCTLQTLITVHIHRRSHAQQLQPVTRTTNTRYFHYQRQFLIFFDQINFFNKSKETVLIPPGLR